MRLVKITSKGQMTLPVEIRRKLDIHEGEYVSLHCEPDGSVRLRKVQESRPLSDADPIWDLIHVAEARASYETSDSSETTEIDGMEREINRWHES